MATFWSSDICWCIFKECPHKKCFRHLSNLPKDLGYYTVADLKGTNSCPHQFDFYEGGKIRNGKRVPSKKYQAEQSRGTDELRKVQETRELQNGDEHGS